MKTTHKISLSLLVLIVTSGTFWACNRTVKNDEVLGNTELKSAPADFSGIVAPGTSPVTKRSGTTISTQVVNSSSGGLKFANGYDQKVFFENTFSHEITWFVTFVGRTSKAVKTYTGTSNSLDINSFFWDGSAEGRFFLRADSIDYKLSFLGTSIKYTGTLFILDQDYGPIQYDYKTKTLANGNVLKYRSIDDMDGSGSGVKTSYSDAADGSGKAVFFVTDKVQRSGHFSYHMNGTDNNGNGYCGGSSGEALAELNKITTFTDPSKIYFNAYIYGYGRPNTSVFFQAFENDFASPPGAFPVRDVTKNDMYYTIIEVNWTGWKLVSVPYSSFKPANNPASGGGGNRIKEPHKLCGFGLELDSYPTTGLTVEAAIDDIYLTENGPFQP